jgi:hypothetical protein
MTRMQARRDESIWSTDAAAGYCRPVIVRADTAPSGRARAGAARSFFQRLQAWLRKLSIGDGEP